MSDHYPNFAALAADTVEGIDYRIDFEDRGSAFLIMAPHGGGIERGTSELAREIAGVDLAFYLFEGLRRSGNGKLHITSTNFDEPTAQQLLGRSERVIAMHGREDDDDTETVWLGGRAQGLRDAIGESLKRSEFRAELGPRLPGVEKANVCNRGTAGEGVQLELPFSLRQRLIKDQELLRSFASAIRQAL